MVSKHFKWQLRWSLDLAGGSAAHETGLQVRYVPAPGQPDVVRAEAVNAEQIMPALSAKHGPHNAPQMLERMLREARDLRAAALLKAGGTHA